MEESTIENNILVDLNPTMFVNTCIKYQWKTFQLKVRDYQDGLKKQDLVHKR